MSPDKQAGRPVFRVVDAMKAPYSGQILRVRLAEGKAPSLREIKGSRFRARSPDGTETTVRVDAFSTIGGKQSDARFARTGRLDLVVSQDPGEPRVALRWSLTGPV
jgi:hypothetical protein